ncbi:hypothetical protein AB0F77_39520 [Streptomyces sp. NPDC026672]|uniref:hypothetical protein n=1 Tax=Actinomycetes TaxID=1760 RepID=UPI0033D9B87F
MSPKKVVAQKSGADVMRVDVDSLQTLDLESIQDESETALIARGAAYAREYAAIEDKPTILAINLATVLVAIRRQHGDWLGSSRAYRQAAAEVYQQANVPPEKRERLQGNVRYHIGNLLRRYLTPRELRSLGLLDTSPLERQQDIRATNTALLVATRTAASAEESSPKKSGKAPKPTQETVPTQPSGPGSIVRATADNLRLATVARNLVDQLDTDVIDEHMTDGQRAKLEGELAALENAARRLRRHLKTRSS